MNNEMPSDFLLLREALEASWDETTSYKAVKQEGNPALGQCYPTSRVLQYFFPEMEVVKGKVWNGKEIETHFWNVLSVNGSFYHIDLTWQQFPPGSSVREYLILDRDQFDDSEQTVTRCTILRERVTAYRASF